MAISNKSQSKTRKFIGFSLNSVAQAFSSVANRPFSFLFFVLVLTLTISELTTRTFNSQGKYTQSYNSILGQFYTKYRDDANIGTIATYINNHRNNTIGFTAHLTTITAVVGSSVILPYGAASGLFCFLIPEANLFEYFVQAILFLLYFKLNAPQARIYTILIGVILYIGGWAFQF
nr:hypothetical protein 1 [Hubei tombus-like virus 28]